MTTFVYVGSWMLRTVTKSYELRRKWLEWKKSAGKFCFCSFLCLVLNCLELHFTQWV